MKPDSVIIELSPRFEVGAKKALQNTQLRRNMGKATQTIRAKRSAVVDEKSDWQALREAGWQIKADVMAQLDTYLVQLEAAVTAAGGVVHWARDAREANHIVTELIRQTGTNEIIKVKSLTTDEIRLNEHLEEAGIQAIETDLAELIIQLANEKSSHILVPAIHKNRSEIRALFQKAMNLPDLTDEPKALAAAARQYLREKFMSVKVATSGANFAIAETGSVCVVESEGNGRMCLTMPDVLITVMGIEKILPKWQDLGVFMQLLPRSSTGERMNPYTSIWTGVTPGDGPQQFHLVLLDNGRTSVLADAVGRQTLHCIRCSACINICPVYERTGGHAYGSVYPGPIGAILTPQLVGTAHASSLPYASSLCGACYDVCPVKINIPEVLVHLRGQVVAEKQKTLAGALDVEAWGMQGLATVFANRRAYEAAQSAGRLAQWPFVNDGYIDQGPGPLAAWTAMRDLGAIPQQSFRSWWRERQKHEQ
ncbi:MAG: iron-sulfur cluster-binding protein [Chloroflexi bacterium]|nr:iron-sulfur cluster-binding protein [Chloroflexota bacterium]